MAVTKPQSPMSKSDILNLLSKGQDISDFHFTLLSALIRRAAIERVLGYDRVYNDGTPENSGDF